jgi:transposase-like protein
VTSQKNGASAASVQRVLGLRSYQTAWTWMHKLRRAMVRPGRESLHGRVEVDETFVGGEDPKDGTWVEQKALVVIAAEEDGLGIGRIRLATAEDATRRSLHRFVKGAIAPGSLVHTDGRTAYEGLEAFGYKHRQTVLLGRKDQRAASKLLPRVHRVARF